MSPKSSSGSSSSMRSARSRTVKTRQTVRRPEGGLTTFSFKELESSSSPSPLEQVFQSHSFQIDWANDLRVHLAKQVLCLRRFREFTQEEVAKRMGTSQSKIARIEGAQENVTVDTIGRLLEALEGRLRVFLEPAELQFPEWPSWSDCVESGLGSLRPFHLQFAMLEEDEDGSGNLYGVWGRESRLVSAPAVTTFEIGGALEQGKSDVA